MRAANTRSATKIRDSGSLRASRWRYEWARKPQPCDFQKDLTCELLSYLCVFGVKFFKKHKNNEVISSTPSLTRTGLFRLWEPKGLLHQASHPITSRAMHVTSASVSASGEA